MEETRILVVDDEQEIADLLELYLISDGYQVIKSEDALEGLAIMEREKIDLVLLDIMMPKMDGLEMCRKIREKHNVPIISVAAGVLCGLFGVGALLAAYVNRVTDEDSSFKANIGAVFIVDNTFRIILYSALGLLTFDTVLSVLKLIPFALLGLFLGIKCSNHMDGKNVKKITSVLLVLSGISLILKNL